MIILNLTGLSSISSVLYFYVCTILTLTECLHRIHMCHIIYIYLFIFAGDIYWIQPNQTFMLIIKTLSSLCAAGLTCKWAVQLFTHTGNGNTWIKHCCGIYSDTSIATRIDNVLSYAPPVEISASNNASHRHSQSFRHSSPMYVMQVKSDGATPDTVP